MSKLLKLTRARVDSIFRLHALGHQAVAIAELLADGIVADDGAELYPVKVSEGAVRHHLNADGGEEAVRNWRIELYGDVYASPLAYAGERMRQLQRIFDSVRAELDALNGSKGRAGLQSRLMTVIDKAGDLMQQVDPDMTITRTASGGARATVSGKADAATLQRIADKLRAAIGAGAVDLPLDFAEAPAESTGSSLG